MNLSQSARDAVQNGFFKDEDRSKTVLARSGAILEGEV
jgi:hypothetical protein